MRNAGCTCEPWKNEPLCDYCEGQANAWERMEELHSVATGPCSHVPLPTYRRAVNQQELIRHGPWVADFPMTCKFCGAAWGALWEPLNERALADAARSASPPSSEDRRSREASNPNPSRKEN